jgi:hypothetical protein
MSVSTFGVTYTTVQTHFFPSLAVFSGSTKPTSTTVTDMVTLEAARLTGALRAAGITAATISDDAGTTYPAAYAWCQDAITWGTAIRVMRAISGEGAVPTRWHETLKEMYEALAEKGWVVLGDAPAPSQSITGPRSHISNHSLDTGDTADISDMVPRFRRDDEL